MSAWLPIYLFEREIIESVLSQVLETLEDRNQSLTIDHEFGSAVYKFETKNSEVEVISPGIVRVVSKITHRGFEFDNEDGGLTPKAKDLIVAICRKSIRLFREYSPK